MVWKGFFNLHVIIFFILMVFPLIPLLENRSDGDSTKGIVDDHLDIQKNDWIIDSKDFESNLGGMNQSQNDFRGIDKNADEGRVDTKSNIKETVPLNAYEGPKYSNKDHNKIELDTGDLRSGSDWTLMVYLDGNHNLCTHGSSDMAEINASFATNVDVLVLKDDDSEDGNDTRMYYVNGGISAEIHPNWLDDEENMGDGDNLYDFVNWTLSNYPSDRTMLLFWDHGSAYWGCCRDEDTGPDFIEDEDSLRIMEIRDALDRAISPGDKLDIMAFCACSMANTEVCYCMADYADYLLASEQSGWLTESEGFNWDFTLIINEMNSNDDPVDLCEYIVDTTMVNSENVQAHRSHTWSVIDLSEMEDLKDRLDWFSYELMEAFPEYYYEISQARLATEEYKSGVRPDLYHFAQNIKNHGNLPSDLKNAASTLTSGVNNAVIYEDHRTGDDVVTSGLYDPAITSRSDKIATEDKDKTHGPVDNAHGLTVYFPVNHSGESLWYYRSSTHDKVLYRSIRLGRMARDLYGFHICRRQ